MIATPLDVERGQIEAGEGHRTGFEQVVGDFAGDELVETLHGRDEHAAHDLVDGLELHEHLRVEEGLTQEDGRRLFGEGRVHAREERPHQTVPEPVGRRRELVEDARVAVGVVALEVALRQQVQSVQIHSVPTIQINQSIPVHY